MCFIIGSYLKKLDSRILKSVDISLLYGGSAYTSPLRDNMYKFRLELPRSTKEGKAICRLC